MRLGLFLMAVAWSHIILPCQADSEYCFADGPCCKKIDRKDHNSLTSQQLFQLKYYKKKPHPELKELNLAEEIASNWVNLANVLDINPAVVRSNNRESPDALKQASIRLFERLYSEGCHGELNWNAFINAINETHKLNRVVKELVNMLKCLDIDIYDMDAVERKHFHHMDCKKDKTTLNLEESVAEYWRKIANICKINPISISADRGTTEKCAHEVLTKLYDQGYKGSLGWQGVLDALSDGSFEILVKKLDNALDCVAS